MGKSPVLNSGNVNRRSNLPRLHQASCHCPDVSSNDKPLVRNRVSGIVPSVDSEAHDDGSDAPDSAVPPAGLRNRRRELNVMENMGRFASGIEEISQKALMFC